MKRLLFAGMIGAAFATACFAQASGYWVVGNRADGRCDIVTSNPVIFGEGYSTSSSTGYWFESGPYKSLDDARLARSTISACPKDNSNSEN